MRLILTALLLTAAAPAITAAPAPALVPARGDGCTGKPSATRLFVNVSNVRNANGLIAVTLYADDRSRFLAKRGSLYVGRVPAVAGTTRVCIHLPTPGTYAVAVYHDEDSSRKLNRSGLGLPREGYGFSNNASTVFGLPNFSSVRFTAARSGLQTGVRLKYP